MTNPPSDFALHLHYTVPAEQLFAALATETGTQGWWTLFAEVDERIGGVSSFHFPGGGFYAVMKTVEHEPPHLLVWECVDSRHSDSTGYADLGDWVGTTVRFAIQPLGGAASRLDFTHVGLQLLECRESCRSGWSFFLEESLRGYLERGQGQPWLREA
ncbi:SRPBCC domain-containing protein [Neisseriaceae bacterium JH1-16]|nr:SRPBCC domain-containing protein [Neisseriaceae bacterium JH1-16]